MSIFFVCTVFKVETIGGKCSSGYLSCTPSPLSPVILLFRPDAYMGVTNLEGNMNHCHAKNVAEFAVDLINEAGKILIDEDEPEKGHINIRVGFHSGPVVSNVIG